MYAKIMCNDCCKVFTRWRKSFTKIETCLSILETVLLIVFIGFLVFLILHFLACSSHQGGVDQLHSTTTNIPDGLVLLSSFKTPVTRTERTHITTPATALAPGIKCTWSPSAPTSAPTHYYEHEKRPTDSYVSKAYPTGAMDHNIATEHIKHGEVFGTEINNRPPMEYFNEDLVPSDRSDGEDPEEVYRSYVLALVKLKPPTGVTFGCILTAISEFWTLTAASCVESIEEVDSLDFYVMMEKYGEVRQGRTHAVADVRVHPHYRRGERGDRDRDRDRDLAALRSEDRLPAAVPLPATFDYLMITIGQRFTILGYGPFRSIDKGPDGRRIRKVYVYSLPPGQCAGAAGEGGAWAARHLVGGAGEARAHAACGAAPLCAGALHARGAACNYCAGTPLLAGAGAGVQLLAVMSDDRQCGAACEPQLYVNVAAARDWLDSLLHNN